MDSLGRLAGPISNTGCEPKFCIDVDSERTPINLPSRNSDTETATGGVQLVEANTNGEHPTVLVVQLGVNANEAKVFKAHASPLGLRDNLVKSLKLLANQQKDGDSPIQNIVTGLHERSRRGIMDGLRSFIRADNHRAVEVGHLRAGTILLHVRKPKFS